MGRLLPDERFPILAVCSSFLLLNTGFHGSDLAPLTPGKPCLPSLSFPPSLFFHSSTAGEIRGSRQSQRRHSAFEFLPQPDVVIQVGTSRLLAQVFSSHFINCLMSPLQQLDSTADAMWRARSGRGRAGKGDQ